MKTLGFFLACLLCVATSGQGTTRVKKSKLKESEVKELVQAVQDEIYDYEYEDEYFPEGGPVGEVVSGSRVRVPLYIDPVLEDREGQAIYKLMPDGEVLRRFHVHQDGMVVLDGDPELGFPATQPDRKTVYLKDSEVCRMKREWVKASFDLDLDPDAERVKEAVRRQKQRNGGFSAWEFARSKLGKKPPRD